MKSSTHVVHGGAVHFRDDFRNVHIIASSSCQDWSIWAAPALFTATPGLAKPVAWSNARQFQADPPRMPSSPAQAR